MTIYYLMNDRHEILRDGFHKFDENCLSMDSEEYHIANGYNGALFFKDYMQTDEYKEREAEALKYAELKDLRLRRREECFAVVDRSRLWYDTLTTEQMDELREWYNAWLNVTDTRIIPEKPEWLKEL